MALGLAPPHRRTRFELLEKLGGYALSFLDRFGSRNELGQLMRAEDVKAIRPILWVQHRITPNKVGKL